MRKCPRCKKSTASTMMSMFNTEEICIECIELESNHPKYAEATKAEREALDKGDKNFQGIGCPQELYKN